MGTLTLNISKLTTLGAALVDPDEESEPVSLSLYEERIEIPNHENPIAAVLSAEAECEWVAEADRTVEAAGTRGLLFAVVGNVLLVAIVADEAEILPVVLAVLVRGPVRVRPSAFDLLFDDRRHVGTFI